MIRLRFLSVLLLGLSPMGLAGQEQPVGTRLYMALYNIRYSDVPEWTAFYYEHSVPVLEELVAGGSLTGFNMRMHHTGGEYTIRQGLVGQDDADFDQVWETYLGRLAEADPTGFVQTNRMIVAHTDEIWTIDVANLPAGGGETQYTYEAQFQVNFADLDRWNALWAQDVLPVLDRLMADGLLAGYVVEGHNTGGPYNWKILYLFDEWDNLDEMEAAVFEAVPLDHPVWSMFTAHKDELWQALPPPN